MLALLSLGVVFLDFVFNVLDLEELSKFMEAMQCFFKNGILLIIK